MRFFQNVFLLSTFVLLWAVACTSSANPANEDGGSSSLDNGVSSEGGLNSPLGSSSSQAKGRDCAYTLTNSPRTGAGTLACDEKTYNTVTIGSQVWMAENMDFGVRVAGVSDQSDATGFSAQKYCYQDNEANCSTYGALYQWHTVMAMPFICNSKNAATSGCMYNIPHQGICPQGWHVPELSEWARLETWVDSNNGSYVPGHSLQSTNIWSRPGSDTYGWGGLPGGYRLNRDFYQRTNSGYWWSATQRGDLFAWYRYIDFTGKFLEDDAVKSDMGLSLRCVQNATASSSSVVSSSSSAPGSSSVVSSSSSAPSSSSVASSSSSSLSARCNTAGNCGTFTDSRDSKSYRWTKIGDQVWMAENLDFGTYIANGNGTNQTDATTTSAQKYCYGDNESNCTTYGGLYQWHTVMALPFSCNSTDVGTAPCIVNTPHRGICALGWHVPTQEEWTTLEAWVDKANDGAMNNNEGTSLKSTTLWSSGAGTDAYSWNGLPGGNRRDGSFNDQGSRGVWRSASQNSASYAWYRRLGNGYAYLNEFYDYKSNYGFSLRCLQD
jgi:uncharacterized protein (TIGR02145 family)